LAKLAEARAKIEARPKERYEREKAEDEAKMAALEAKAKATGKKTGDKPPQPPAQAARQTDQINLTDEASCLMPVAGDGYDQCYNPQAVVAADSLLVIATQVVQAPNDKQQIGPMLKRIEALPAELGKPKTLLADAGYFSEANVMCAAAKIDPTIAQGRQTSEGKKLYALRKKSPEPVFGIIKSVMGFRRILLRGIDNVQGEWSLSIAWNMKRIYVLSAA
jgi:hypothetical protein